MQFSIMVKLLMLHHREVLTPQTFGFSRLTVQILWANAGLVHQSGLTISTKTLKTTGQAFIQLKISTGRPISGEHGTI